MNIWEVTTSSTFNPSLNRIYCTSDFRFPIDPFCELRTFLLYLQNFPIQPLVIVVALSERFIQHSLTLILHVRQTSFLYNMLRIWGWFFKKMLPSNLLFLICTRTLFATIPLNYIKAEKHSFPAGMIINEQTGSSSPIEESEQLLYLEEEGIECCSLFFIPTTLSFVLLTQFQMWVPHTSALFESICRKVMSWTEQFYQRFMDVWIT